MFKIADRKISSDRPPYIIAELSANHNGDIERAYSIIRSAKENGADAVKLQAYSADSMTIDCDRTDFQIKSGTWAGYNLYKLYEEAGTPLEWQRDLFECAKEVGITCFSTPFDEAAVDVLYKLDAPAFKVASFEMTDHALLKRIGETGKPVLMSTGLASVEEIEESIGVLREAGAEELLVFHCVSAYPAPIDQSRLKTIPFLREKLGIEIGLSDHTLGTTASVAAVSLGASAIEKHYTLRRSDGGADSMFSLEPSDLKKLVNETRDAWSALGDNSFKRSEIEEDNLVFRRSLYFVKDLNEGDTITEESVKSIRPGYGLPPKHLKDVIGKTAALTISKGDRVEWASFK